MKGHMQATAFTVPVFSRSCVVLLGNTHRPFQRREVKGMMQAVSLAETFVRLIYALCLYNKPMQLLPFCAGTGAPVWTRWPAGPRAVRQVCEHAPVSPAYPGYGDP